VIGGFAATGGETAAVLLSRFGVEGAVLPTRSSRVCRPGGSLGKLSIPVATKAGAFGDRFSLIHISERFAPFETRKLCMSIRPSRSPWEIRPALGKALALRGHEQDLQRAGDRRRRPPAYRRSNRRRGA
jgi:hypothetical protein